MHMTHDLNAPAAEPVSFADFLKVDIRVGEVIAAEAMPEARRPSVRLVIHFGPVIGTQVSCAQIAALYQPSELIGRRVLAVVNFPPRQIGKTMSEALTLGVPDEHGQVVLIAPDRDTPIGGRLF